MQTTSSSQIMSKPFLKWAGGKYRLAERIRQRLPDGKRLIEPFVGSAAIFLNTSYDSYLLNDINEDLINVFEIIKSSPDAFIKDAKILFSEKNNSESAFYDLRSEFNATENIYRKSLIFIYLNRHCFNGLCRYNKSGGFNVPYGRYKKPYFPEQEILLFSKKSKIAKFSCSSFDEVMLSAEVGDIVYCDPPYVPLSESSNFTSYAKGGFDQEDQIKLVECARVLMSRGVPVIISNHDTPLVRQKYTGAKMEFFSVQRNISCDGKNRSAAPELLAVFM